jgi:hypothetical protein
MLQGLLSSRHISPAEITASLVHSSIVEVIVLPPFFLLRLSLQATLVARASF